MKKKVLFISHYASRTGAPIVLLNLLQWLKANTSIAFEIIQVQEGPLLDDFHKIAPNNLFTSTMAQRKVHSLLNLFGLKTDITKGYWNGLIEKYSGRVGLIYSNTITNGEALDRLSGLNCPVICHVHEQELAIRFFGNRNLELVKQYTNHYIAASEQVKQNLILNHGIPEDKIDVVYSFIDVASLKNNFRDIRGELNIPADAAVVCGSGHGTIWNKGKDLFLQLTRIVNDKSAPSAVYFLWVGGSEDGMDIDRIQRDIRLTGIKQIVRFIEDVDDPYAYFNACDIFVSTSREDSFPLVCLEAAALGKPVLCFEGAGGMLEFVEDDAGYIIPYLDIKSMADRIIALTKDPALRIKIGLQAALKVKKRHDISVACPAFLEIIERFL